MSGSNGKQTVKGSTRRHVMPWLVLGMSILAVIVVLVTLGLSGRSLPIPNFIVGQIEVRANRALQGQARLTVGRADLVVGAGFVPQIRFGDVTLLSPRGQRLALVSDLRTTMDMESLMSGRVQPAKISVHGAKIAIRRQPDGGLDIAPAARNFSGVALTPAQILDSIDRTFAAPTLSDLQSINVDGLSVLFDDRRAGQVWTIIDGTLDLRQTKDRIRIDFGFGVTGQAAAALAAVNTTNAPAKPVPASVALSLTTDKHTSGATLGATLAGISAKDLSLQVPALAWLGAIDAPIAGQFDSGLDTEGRLGIMTARLSLGSGALRPTKDTPPVPFDSATLGLSYDPDKLAINLTDLKIKSPQFSADAAGQAWLKNVKNGIPGSLVAQVQLKDLKADPRGIFSRPLSIGQGAMDFKLDLAPFKITIGQLTIVDQGNRISANGSIGAGRDGWSVGIDMAVDTLKTNRMLELWPVSALPNTRKWLADNLTTGELYDVKGALRLDPGEKPRFALDYHFRDADIRFMRTMPLITDSSGYSSITGDTFTLVAEKGKVTAPQGGDLDISGTVMRIPDIHQIPAPAEFTLKIKSSVTAALSILDQEPFKFLTKANQPVDLAEGRAEISAALKLPLKRKILNSDVDYQATAVASDVSTDKLIKSRVLAAKALTVTADRTGLKIAGDATLDGIPVSGAWTQAFGPENQGKSKVDGNVEITPAALRAFAITLPDGAVKGKGTGDIHIDLTRGAPPAYRLTSNLVGLTLAIPEVGWKKPVDAGGSLLAEGSFGAPAKIDVLEIKGAKLEAKGSVILKPDGSFDKAAFKQATLSDWFKGDVTLSGRGKGKAVGIDISNATADMRKANFGSSASSGGDAPPLSVSLDRLRISEDISLTNFIGQFSTKGGVKGTFVGAVNGDAPITGTVATTESGRAAFEVKSVDAGKVFAAADIYESGRGGQLDLVLRPVGDKGSYDGLLNIGNIRVVDAPELAGLLDAISVVGLINQLRGSGIVFSDVTGRFLLTPDAVEIQQGSAVGASLGVSAAGVYRSTDHSIDLQGVISPIYLLNGIGQIFSRQRDGLFGFNYTLTGTRDQTKVSVNPLSILTPGMFRDLFRKDPPRIEP
ncbi:MAG: DUF3971 domain-containing protein [Paracoccaceae bacterium]